MFRWPTRLETSIFLLICLIVIAITLLFVVASFLSPSAHHTLFFTAASAAAVMSAGIFLGHILSRRMTRPLVQLQEMTKRVADGDLAVHIDVASCDEAKELALSFNAMTTALRQTTVWREYVDNVLSSISDALFVLTPENTITTINASACRLLGYASAELEGHPADLLFDEVVPLRTTLWGPCSRGERVQNLPATLRTRNGARIHTTLSATPTFDHHHHFRGTIIVALDTSEPHRLMEEVRERSVDLERHRLVLMSMLEDNERARATAEAEHEKSKTAMDSMTEGIIIIDFPETPSYLNTSARQILGLDNSQMPNLLGISQSLGITLDILRPSPSRGDIPHIVHDIVLGDTLKHTIHIEGFGIGASSQHPSIMLVLRDITRERQLDEAKHELITNVSHELRTPLASIVNIVSNILVGVTGTINDKLRTHLEIARTNTKRLANIIDNLLDIASLDAGKTTIQRELTDLLPIIRNTTKEFQAEAQEKHLTFNMLLPAEPMILFCDPLAITQIVRNLLSNAFRYTPAGGVVSLSVEHLDRAALISCQDSGIGIPSDDQRFVFERFHQVGRTYGPGEKGLGLGLPIARRLVELHDGSIGVTSTPGKGSLFSCRIPIHVGDHLIAAAIVDQRRPAKKRDRVLNLWIFSPRLPEHIPQPFSEEALAAAFEQLRLEVRDRLQAHQHVIAHTAERHEVLALVTLPTTEQAAELKSALATSLQNMEVLHQQDTIRCSVAMHQLLITDEDIAPAHAIELLRQQQS